MLLRLAGPATGIIDNVEGPVTVACAPETGTCTLTLSGFILQNLEAPCSVGDCLAPQLAQLETGAPSLVPPARSLPVLHVRQNPGSRCTRGCAAHPPTS